MNNGNEWGEYNHEDMQRKIRQMQMQLLAQGLMPFSMCAPVPDLNNSTSTQQNENSNSDSDADEDSEENRTLFCGNLDENVSEELLYEIFINAGPIESVRIPNDNAGQHRGFGFVTYMQISAVPYALSIFEGLKLFNKRVTINIQGMDRVQLQQQKQQQQQLLQQQQLQQIQQQQLYQQQLQRQQQQQQLIQQQRRSMPEFSTNDIDNVLRNPFMQPQMQDDMRRVPPWQFSPYECRQRREYIRNEKLYDRRRSDITSDRSSHQNYNSGGGYHRSQQRPSGRRRR